MSSAAISQICFFLGGAAGVREVTWNGRDKNDAVAEPGVYFARLLTPMGRKSVRFVVLR